ncbi:MAG: hypothetical protein MI976_08725 [Pseudomonadales bacterium]|nr:hypothetical protein [Pseudomonadales bacterium]
MPATTTNAQSDLLSLVKQDWQCLSLPLLKRLATCELPLAEWIARRQQQKQSTLMIGINGPQGSGKSTTCACLEVILQHYFGLRVAVVSIDDFYLTKAQRIANGNQIHPLLVTRGVPGTHDIPLAIKTLHELQSQQRNTNLTIPRFNKAIDDRYSPQDWTQVATPIDVILFEGWCVGATPESDASLLAPINRLERDEDAKGDWRHYVNTALADGYHTLFGLLDHLVLFEYGDFSWVFQWRQQQEKDNAAKAKNSDTRGIMDDAALERFILHYERVTRNCQEVLPKYADVCIHLTKEREVTALTWKSAI